MLFSSSVFFGAFFVPFRCSLLNLGIASLSLAYFVTDCSNEKCVKSLTLMSLFPKNFKVQAMMNELMESSGSVACADGMQEDPGSSSTVSVMSQLFVNSE